jgi:hypothetical protein
MIRSLLALVPSSRSVRNRHGSSLGTLTPSSAWPREPDLDRRDLGFAPVATGMEHRVGIERRDRRAAGAIVEE